MTKVNQAVPKHIIWIKVVIIPLLCFIWGVGVGGFKVFPFSLIKEPLTNVQEWWQGAQEGQQLNFRQKISELLFDSELRISGKSEIDQRFDLKLKQVKDPKGLLKVMLQLVSEL